MRTSTTLEEMQKILDELEENLPTIEYQGIAAYIRREEHDRAWISLAGHTWQMFSVHDPALFEHYWKRLNITGDLAQDVLDVLGRGVSGFQREPGNA